MFFLLGMALIIFIPTCVSTCSHQEYVSMKIEKDLAWKRQKDYDATHPYSYIKENPKIPYVGIPESMIDSTV